MLKIIIIIIIYGYLILFLHFIFKMGIKMMINIGQDKKNYSTSSSLLRYYQNRLNDTTVDSYSIQSGDKTGVWIGDIVMTMKKEERIAEIVFIIVVVLLFAIFVVDAECIDRIVHRIQMDIEKRDTCFAVLHR